MRRPPHLHGTTDLPVLLPVRITAAAPVGYGALAAGLCRVETCAFMLLLFVGSTFVAEAQAASAQEQSVLAALLKWTPLLLKGFLLNLLVSLVAMSVGTSAGILLGLAQISVRSPARWVAWALTQFFRNAPWLVLLFYAILIIPFEIHVFGVAIPFPAWIKAVIGLSLPVAANVSEIVRGGIQSIPQAQWESAESLAFTRRQILWEIILPQALKRMIPPWMNLYAVLTMATSLISIVGVEEALTYARAALSAEGRPDLLLPMYSFLLFLFFAYCYPIARWTMYLERRYAVNV